MTGRSGAGLPPARPPTPTDPTLASRPVPRKRTFPIRSFGPGAAIDTSITAFSDAKATADYWEELEREANVGSENDRANEDRCLLDTIRSWEAVSRRDDQTFTPQPTWGYYVFLTDYDQVTRNNLPRAMENWVKAIQRVTADPPTVYGDEVVKRLRLDVVDDQDALEHASVDRVRECFRALIRSFELSDDEDGWGMPPPRNSVCLVLNARKVQMLADLTFHEDRMKELRAFLRCYVQAVDIAWQRPETTRDKYRGCRDISIIGLARAYHMLDGFQLDELSD